MASTCAPLPAGVSSNFELTVGISMRSVDCAGVARNTKLSWFMEAGSLGAGE
jgi:hypothetical protein